MIIVDTNVLSELMRPAPESAVRDWVRSQAEDQLDGLDAQIAAVCRVHDARLATRNLKDFRETGIDVIDPWQHA
jgi:predicted nucleic acid-binding protein